MVSNSVGLAPAQVSHLSTAGNANGPSAAPSNTPPPENREPVNDTVTISSQAKELAKNEKLSVDAPSAIKNDVKDLSNQPHTSKGLIEFPGGQKYVISTGRMVKSKAAKMVDQLRGASGRGGAPTGSVNNNLLSNSFLTEFVHKKFETPEWLIPLAMPCRLGVQGELYPLPRGGPPGARRVGAPGGPPEARHLAIDLLTTVH